MLQAKSLSYSVILPDGLGHEVLRGLDFSVEPGQLVGLVGGNGSGKSALARLLNGLLRPTAGVVEVDGLNTALLSNRNEVLRRVGMVFQNPDAQLVATVVEEDVAFGPENQGLPEHEIKNRVERALEAVGIADLRDLSPQRLSGGQKQRVAIAAALASSPRYLILDEPTSMLDPAGRQEFLEAIKGLKGTGLYGIVFITHRLEELQLADSICFLNQGQIQLRVGYEELASHRQVLQDAAVALPAPLELAARLAGLGFAVPSGGVESLLATAHFPEMPIQEIAYASPLLVAEGLGRVYGQLTPWEHVALRDVSLVCHTGESLGLVGSTGSGKSTLAQHFNGLLRPQSGSLTIGGKKVPVKGGDLSWLRRQVGLVFQNPEHQFFEESVASEVSFGPRNFGVKGSELELAVSRSLELVGLGQEGFGLRNPHELSGGEKRLVALASVLASSPLTLVLDEPTAGLDARHRLQILRLLKRWQAETGATLIVISHEIDDLALLVERCLVLGYGRLLADDNFRRLLPKLDGLGVPLPWLPASILRNPRPPANLPVVPEEFLRSGFHL